ncbi:MAG TPA: hypothetical protein VFS41_10290 [Edaphobacter sp.]|nr:hypothetical protein [Edaphobacter sp.]
MIKSTWNWIAVAFVAAGVTMVSHAQEAPAHGRQVAPTSLVVHGYEGQVPVIQRNGHAYVEVEGLARITESSLSFHGSRILLTLPQTAPSLPATASPVNPPAPVQEEKGYSREFLRAAVEEMSVIREWRSAIENAIRTNNPVEQGWVSNYRTIADTRMEMASASATTDADRQALALLQNAKGMVQQLSDRFLSLRSTLTYVSPDSLDNDPLDKKILACAQGVTGQAIPGGQFQDVSACH